LVLIYYSLISTYNTSIPLSLYLKGIKGLLPINLKFHNLVLAEWLLRHLWMSARKIGKVSEVGYKYRLSRRYSPVPFTIIKIIGSHSFFRGRNFRLASSNTMAETPAAQIKFLV
jgi:hypothetical protein